MDFVPTVPSKSFFFNAGLRLGLTVLTTVGPGVGSCDGKAVGEFVRDLVGGFGGITVGAELDTGVGGFVGATAGASVGISVGDLDGGSVGTKVGTRVVRGDGLVLWAWKSADRLV